MSRLVSAATLVFDQVDIRNPSGTIIRATGVVVSNLDVIIFVNNSLLSWDLQDGTLIPDSSISSGVICFNEISGSSGYYSVRFFPDRIGFWRLIFTNASLGEEIILEYDVVPAKTFAPTSANGLNASFTRD